MNSFSRSPRFLFDFPPIPFPNGDIILSLPIIIPPPPNDDLSLLHLPSVFLRWRFLSFICKPVYLNCNLKFNHHSPRSRRKQSFFSECRYIFRHPFRISRVSISQAVYLDPTPTGFPTDLVCFRWMEWCSWKVLELWPWWIVLWPTRHVSLESSF